MIRTRFAPSPTGYLHIGGVRTALFNWLLAKHAGGQFILRIDDTDQQRNVEEAIEPILNGFRWLGMQWDEGPEVGGPHEPYYQSQRGERHREAAAALLESGHAYRDYSTPEEYGAQREAAQKAGKPFIYDRAWMAEDEETAKQFESEGRKAVVRLKMPREGTCVIDDLVRGEVRVDWISEQDHVIQRSDGSCLYHLASAIDDHDLEITHVVRAEEHLANTARQIFIMQSLGYALPKFAHVPAVSEPGGTAKLSKRKLSKYEKNKDFAQLFEQGLNIAKRCQISVAADTFNPVIVDFYREIGFEPSAILNYLILLGWSLDGKTEKFSVDQMIELFSLDRVNKSPSKFDPKKLLAFQGDAFAALPLEDRIRKTRPFAERAGLLNGEDAETTLREVVENAHDRLKIAGDILDFDYFFVDGPIDYDAKAFQKRICKPAQAQELLAKMRDFFEADQAAWNAESIQASVSTFCEQAGIELKDIIHALRVATTGKPAGFGTFETLEVLGKDRVVKRIGMALESAATICST